MIVLGFAEVSSELKAFTSSINGRRTNENFNDSNIGCGSRGHCSSKQRVCRRSDSDRTAGQVNLL
jgi:hypothetical protein